MLSLFVPMTWPAPWGTIWGGTLGQLDKYQWFNWTYTPMGQCNRPETSDSSQNCKLMYAIGVIIFWTFPKDIFTLLLRWNSCDGLKSRFGDTAWIQPTHSANKSWIYAWFGVRITNFFLIKFLPFPWFEPSFWGRLFSAPFIWSMASPRLGETIWGDTLW